MLLNTLKKNTQNVQNCVKYTFPSRDDVSSETCRMNKSPVKKEEISKRRNSLCRDLEHPACSVWKVTEDVVGEMPKGGGMGLVSAI